MACGCCIVGSRGMPVQEVIHDGVEGVLVPMADPNTLAQKILALLANPSMRDQLGAAARQSALGWDQRVMLPKLTALVERGEAA